MFLSIRSLMLLMTATTATVLPQNCETGHRNPKDYDALGPLEIAPGKSSNLPEVRAFMWSHWHNHKLGEVIVYRVTTEGMRGTERLFIEPDPSRQWSVQVEVYRGAWAVAGSPAACYRVHDVVRQQLDPNGVVAKVLAKEDIREPSEYRIALLDENRNETVFY